VRENFKADEYAISKWRAAPDSDWQLATGRVALPHGLTPGRGATVLMLADEIPIAIAADGAGGRMIVFAGEPEKTAAAERSANTYLGDFIGQSVRWLARQPTGAAGQKAEQVARPATEPAKTIDLEQSFPVTMQFSPIPYEGVVTPTAFPATASGRRRIIDSLIDHGVTLLQCPLPLPEEQAKEVEAYARSRGMGFTWYLPRGLEKLKRDEPPEPSFYSDAYRAALDQRTDATLAEMAKHPGIASVFPMMDEPFHAGVESFGNTPEERDAFHKKFGYDLPGDAMAVRNDPQRWLDLINVRAGYFPVAWREI